ncbi:MAG: zinc ribbon domain-containing protein [Xanthomonadaceae bacterium]|nr:zinc ribbon domain-containing protein [Xanthomonadaceae bacterium]
MALIKCPDCGANVSDAAKACIGCGRPIADHDTLPSVHAGPGSRRTAQYVDARMSTKRANEGVGIAMLVTPFIAALFMYFWVGQMALIQDPESTLAFLAMATVVVTAILAAMEASMAGMESDPTRGTYSPVSWFFIITLLWVVGYPAYLFKRRTYGFKNYLVGSLVVMVVFLGLTYTMYGAIESQKDGVRNQLQQLQEQLQKLSH